MRWLMLGVAALALAGCSKRQDGASATKTLGVFDAAPAPVAPGGTAAAPGPIAVSVPQIAYVYRYAFRLPDDAIARVQAAHVALCDRLGPARCQLVASETGGGEGQAAAASLKLRVASSEARAFGAALTRAATAEGGRAVDASIAAGDVSKDIVDTDARLRQRTVLVDRLTEILRTHQGKVSELVEAERSVAAAQEEIDQAKGELAELRGRVALSRVEISYDAIAAAPGGAGGGLGEAVAQSWSAFVFGLALLLRLAIVLLPWALLGGVVFWVVRRVRPHRLIAPPSPSPYIAAPPGGPVETGDTHGAPAADL